MGLTGVSRGGSPPSVCGAVRSLPAVLVLDALTAAPLGDDEADVLTELRCEIEEDHHGLHAAAVRLLGDCPPETVWTQWADWRDPEAVLVLRDCSQGDGPPGEDDWCTLFVGHPGACSYRLADPEHEEFLAANPTYRHLYEGGGVLVEPTEWNPHSGDSTTGYCCLCGRRTEAPVVIAYVGMSSGLCVTHYVCAEHAHTWGTCTADHTAPG